MFNFYHVGDFFKKPVKNFSVMLLDSKLIQLKYKSKLRKTKKFSFALDK